MRSGIFSTIITEVRSRNDLGAHLWDKTNKPEAKNSSTPGTTSKTRVRTWFGSGVG
jgi:hypothetical protein